MLRKLDASASPTTISGLAVVRIPTAPLANVQLFLAAKSLPGGGTSPGFTINVRVAKVSILLVCAKKNKFAWVQTKNHAMVER